MSGETSIQWTNRVWNPTVGCKRVSAGCDHCYAFQLHDQRYIAWKRGRFPTAPVQYHQPFSKVQILPERLRDPLRWRKPSLIFVNSMSDLFHEDVPETFIDSVLQVIDQAKQHTFQVLTKRPERMLATMQRWEEWRHDLDGVSPVPANLWLGVSVEDQRAADERIPLLLETPAAVRFLSCEPLLGPVDLSAYLTMPRLSWVCRYRDELMPCRNPSNPRVVAYRPLPDGSGMPLQREIDWVIVGGESGLHFRPMNID